MYQWFLFSDNLPSISPILIIIYHLELAPESYELIYRIHKFLLGPYLIKSTITKVGREDCFKLAVGLVKYRCNLCMLTYNSVFAIDISKYIVMFNFRTLIIFIDEYMIIVVHCYIFSNLLNKVG